MLSRKGKILLDSFKSTYFINNVRSLTLPQSAEKPSAASPISVEKKKKKPLMKNVFTGFVDDDYLHLWSKKNFNLPNGLLKFCQDIDKNVEPNKYSNTLKKLAASGFYELYCPGDMRDARYADLLHFLEELNLDPTLSSLLEVQSIIISMITEHGTSEQKDKYLKKIFTGDITGAIAISEESGGCDHSSINMTAREESNGTFILNGEKLWVTNALDADFFVVLVKLPLDNLNPGPHCASEIATLIIDKNSDITLQKHDSSALNDCNLSKVIFKNVSAMPINLLGCMGKGCDVSKETLKNPKFMSVMCIVNNLKSIISDVTKHVNSRKQFPRNLRENELVQLKLCNVVSIVYCLESMMYLTADILDKFITDTSLESALIQIYAFEEGMKALSICMELLGSKVYDKTLNYENLCRDLKGLCSFTNTNMTRLYASLIGLEYAGNHMKEIVMQNRNPFNFPLFAVKKIFSSSQFQKDNVNLSLKLYNNFHPSLKESAELVEYCVIRFQYVIEVLFSRYGADLVHRTIDLNRLADISIEIFSVLSVLSRASHSYCSGVMNCDQEIILARRISYESHVRVKKIMDDIMSLDIKAGDTIGMEIGTHLLSKQKYFIEHPLKHDI